MTGGAEEAAGRVARNTALRALAEFVGKFASLALMAVLARKEGAEGLGVIVFAFAWAELTQTPIEMGFDRLLLRRVAAKRETLGHYLANTFRLKLLRAVPVIAISAALVFLLGYDQETRIAVWLMILAYLCDTLSYTVFAVFNAYERADLIGIALVAQRLASGGLGVAVLLAGYGVDAVAAAYLASTFFALVVGLLLLTRHVERLQMVFPVEQRRELRRESLPFAAQELMSTGLARLDTILLSVIATQAVVGLYGAAYRLLEATLFISVALQGAFSAMFTYLDERSDPPIGAVFARSVKLVLALLLPCAIPLAIVPGPILELFFGDGFDVASDALRALAPVVVLLGMALITGSLIASRLDPKLLVRFFAVTLTVNLAVNVALIPSLDELGAALGMLAAELVLVVLSLRACLKAVGPVDARVVTGAPVIAGAAMAGVILALSSIPLVACVVGGAVYVCVFVVVERRLAPSDFAFLADMVRARLPSKGDRALPNDPLEER